MKLLFAQGLGSVKTAAEIGALNIFRKTGTCIKNTGYKHYAAGCYRAVGK